MKDNLHHLQELKGLRELLRLQDHQDSLNIKNSSFLTYKTILTNLEIGKEISLLWKSNIDTLRSNIKMFKSKNKN